MSPLHLAAYVRTRGASIDRRLPPKGSMLTGSYGGHPKHNSLVHCKDIPRQFGDFKSVDVSEIRRVANRFTEIWRVANDPCS
jgi:hypothetical protein